MGGEKGCLRLMAVAQKDAQERFGRLRNECIFGRLKDEVHRVAKELSRGQERDEEALLSLLKNYLVNREIGEGKSACWKADEKKREQCGRCAVCGKPLGEKFERHRVDPLKGYKVDNFILVHRKCNPRGRPRVEECKG